VGSRTFDGVQFVAWSNDHDPLHVHGLYAGVSVVIDLYPAQRRIDLSRRPKPLNAKRSHIAHILRTAERNFDMLVVLAEETWKRRSQ
jgi:hypothetical protein